MKTYRTLFLFVVLVLAMTGCQPAATAMPTTVPAENILPDQTLVIGVVSSDPAKAIKDFQPIANYLAKNLADQGILTGKVIVVPDAQAEIGKLKSGEVSLYFESPYGAMIAYEAGAIPLLRQWKSGVSGYHTRIAVRKDSGITTIEQLKGRVIAFEDPGSTSGYYLPKAYLMGQGLKLTEKTEYTSTVAGDEIGYFFSDSMENSFALLVAGKVAAAAIQSDAFDSFPTADRDQLIIIAETPIVPRYIVMGSPKLSSTLRDAIVQILSDMEKTEEGRSVLLATQKTARFDQLPLGAVETMQELQALFAPAR